MVSICVRLPERLTALFCERHHNDASFFRGAHPLNPNLLVQMLHDSRHTAVVQTAQPAPSHGDHMPSARHHKHLLVP